MSCDWQLDTFDRRPLARPAASHWLTTEKRLNGHRNARARAFSNPAQAGLEGGGGFSRTLSYI